MPINMGYGPRDTMSAMREAMMRRQGGTSAVSRPPQPRVTGMTVGLNTGTPSLRTGGMMMNRPSNMPNQMRQAMSTPESELIIKVLGDRLRKL